MLIYTFSFFYSIKYTLQPPIMHKSIVLDSLISALNAISEIESRRSLINEDIISSTLKFKSLADHKPLKLFELLGGDINDIAKENYAPELDEEDFDEVDEQEVEEDLRNIKI